MTHAVRVKRERLLKRQPLSTPKELLSSNQKTGVSLNLPLSNCRPTKRCSDACYASAGPISLRNSIRKSLVVDAVLKAGRIERLVDECSRLQDVRLSGSGDLLISQVPAVLDLAKKCPDTTFWGFTRNRKVAEALNGIRSNLSVILSIDATSADTELIGYEGPLAFGPRRPEDEVPDDDRIMVVFPEHHNGRVMKDVPAHPVDCSTVRKLDHGNACLKCKRCHKPGYAVSKSA